MTRMFVAVQSRINSMRSEDGNAAEYGLIIAVVAVVIISGLAILAGALNGLFGTVAGKLGPAAP